MSRTRLTDKTASEVAVNDVYINESRTEGNKNVPMANGTPETWNETPVSTPETAAIHTDDIKRDEMNLHAIKSAADLEGHAVKCLVASQRMLPGADRGTLEANALDLMRLPVASIDGLLSRQETLARTLSASATKVAEDCEEKKVEIEVEKEAAAPATEIVEEDKFEKLASQVAALTDMVAKMAEFKPFEKKEEKEEVKEEGKTASEADALEGIFSAVAPAASKAGAASISGMVRSASATRDEDLLAGLWHE